MNIKPLIRTALHDFTLGVTAGLAYILNIQVSG